MNIFMYLSSHLIAGLSLWGLLAGGWWSYSGFWIVFVVHPLVENIFLKQVAIRRTPGPKLGTFFLLLAIPVVTVVTVLGLYLFVAEKVWAFNLGIVLTVGSLNGILAINVSHELIHRKEKWLRRSGYYLLWIVQFMHWGIEHVHGHHKKIGTFEDPATARRGENLYAFWVRNFVHGFFSAWRHSQILAAGKWYKNKVLKFQLRQLMLLFLVWYASGVEGLSYWVLQSTVAILLLLTVDYTEHYGLCRMKLANGQYEPVLPQHSWDSYLVLTNWVLLNLGFHSSHHFKAVLPYYELPKQQASRKLPLGYSAMVLLALVPPLYKKIMDKELDQVEEQSELAS